METISFRFTQIEKGTGRKESPSGEKKKPKEKILTSYFLEI